MTRFVAAVIGGIVGANLVCAQQTPPQNPDPTAVSNPAYEPPTHSEKFHTYLKHTFGIGSILTAGVHAGIDQAQHKPSEWPEGAEGYAQRFGSALGAHVARGTTAYAFGELFHEDLRYVHCTPNCSVSNRFRIAFENTFTAAKGDDGHREFSAARFLGPISGGFVSSTWRPNGFKAKGVAREIGLNYSLGFARNLVRGFVKR